MASGLISIAAPFVELVTTVSRTLAAALRRTLVARPVTIGRDEDSLSGRGHVEEMPQVAGSDPRRRVAIPEPRITGCNHNRYSSTRSCWWRYMRECPTAQRGPAHCPATLSIRRPRAPRHHEERWHSRRPRAAWSRRQTWASRSSAWRVRWSSCVSATLRRTLVGLAPKEQRIGLAHLLDHERHVVVRQRTGAATRHRETREHHPALA